MDELEYPEETLPEITIREHLSINDLMSDNPSFVALDDDYIEAFAGELFGDVSKGTAFLELHKRVLKQKTKSLVPYARLTVNARRQKLEPEEAGNFFAKINELRKTEYHVAQAELDRLVAVFDTGEEPAEGMPALVLSKDIPRAEILLENQDSSVLLYSDTVKLPVTDISWKPLTWTSENYVFDRIKPAPTESSPYMPEYIHTDLETRIRHRMPQLVDIVKAVSDLHTLKVALAMNAIDFDDLTEDNLATIRGTSAFTYDDDVVVSKKFEPVKSVYSFKDVFDRYSGVITKHIERVDAYMSETRHASLQQAYDAYMANTGAMLNSLEGFPSPFVLAQDLTRGSMTLDQAKQALTDLRNGLNTGDVRSFIQATQKFSKDTAEILLSKIDGVHILDTDAAKLIEWRTSLVGHHEVHEIRKGNDTSMYEGLSTVESVFAGAVEDAGDSEDLMDDFIPAYSEDAEPADVPKNTMDQRSPDHIMHVIQRIKDISDRSGLPWDVDGWLSRGLQYYIFPASRLSQLKTLANNTAESVLADIAAAESKEDAMAIINRLSNKDDMTRLHEGYPRIYKEWSKSCDELFFDGMVYWALDILEKSISGTLDRRNFTEDPDTWSPAGPPLESARSVRRGVFIYIAGLINRDPDDLIQHAKMKYASKLNGIYDIWLSNGKTANLKVDETNQAFVNALTDYKTAKKKGQALKPEFFMATYVPQYLNLPNFKAQKIPDSKQAAWAKGCCLARLDDKYEGDVDFMEKSENLYKVKMKLSDKRWLKTKRPIMMTMHPDAQDSLVDTSIAPVVPVHATSVQTIFDVPNLNEVLSDISNSADIPRMPDLMNMVIAMKLQRDPHKMLVTIVQSNHDVLLYINMSKYVSRITKSTYKQRIDPDLPAAVVKYLMLTMLMQLTNKTLRADIIKELYKMMNNFDIPTPDEVHAYINKQREAIKQIKVATLDSMPKDDKLTELYSSRMGLSSYVDVLDELQKMATGGPGTDPGDTDPNANEGEDEGADDFAPRDRDGDNGADDYYEY